MCLQKEAIPEVKKSIQVEGVCVEDTLVELFLEDKTSLFKETDLLLTTLNLESAQSIMDNGSFSMDVICSGNNIIQSKKL